MASKAGKREIEKLVATINDDPTPRHFDFTPSVSGLIAHGLEGARAVLPLLDDEDEWTRTRAQRVLEGAVMHDHGWEAGRGYPDPSAEDQVQGLLKANGSYDAGASPKKRAAAIEKWRAWLEGRDGDGA